jgi:antibiotic biosynthesis monooxygenase (ABM) superfamily enzyme
MDSLAKFIAAVISVIVLAASLFVGAVVALVVLGFVAIGWAVFAFRMWQARRRVRNAEVDASSSTTVDGDYRVVHDSREDKD